MHAVLKKSVPLSLILLFALTPVVQAQNPNSPTPVPAQTSTAKTGGEQLTQADASQGSRGQSTPAPSSPRTRMSTRKKVIIGVSAGAGALAIGLIVHALTKHATFTGSTNPRPTA